MYSTIFTLVLFYFLATGSTELISFPLKRMKSGLAVLMESRFNPKLKQQFYDLYSGGNDSVKLSKFLDSEFYGEVLIGHPGQKFKVIFDTAWANSWVPSKLCDIVDIACNVHAKYDSSVSSTYKRDDRPIELDYGSSKLIGKFSNDLVHIGHSNITGQVFAEMTSVPMQFLLVKADGIFGLGFPSLAIGNATPFFYNLVQQKTISKKIFSMYFNRDSSSSNGGTLFFGGSESRHYLGNFTYLPLRSQNYWEIDVSSIAVKGKPRNFCETACPVIIDSSESGIQVPASIIDEFSEYIDSRLFYFGWYMVPCGKINQLPAVVFTIGSRDFVLKGKDYVQQMSYEGFQMCMSVFKKSTMTSQFNTTWSLGAAFMSKYYVEFNAEDMKIGFADARL